MADAADALVDRVEDALGAHDVTWDDREAIRVGVASAGGLGLASWDDLSPDVQAKIEMVEDLPRTSWDDPSDVPEDTPDDF